MIHWCLSIFFFFTFRVHLFRREVETVLFSFFFLDCLYNILLKLKKREDFLGIEMLARISVRLIF